MRLMLAYLEYSAYATLNSLLPPYTIFLYCRANKITSDSARAFFARGDEGLRDVYEYHTKVHNTMNE